MPTFILGFISWLMAHPLLLAGIVVIGGLLLWKQPQKFAKLTIAMAMIVAAGYLVSGIVNFTMKSAQTKEQLMDPSPDLK